VKGATSGKPKVLKLARTGRHGMGTKTRVLIVALAGVCALLVSASAASAATPSGVTIHFHHQRFVGFVFSPKPRQCAQDRFVSLYRQEGRKQHPKRDDRLRIARAKGPTSNGKYKWRLPGRGRPGKFYARITAIRSCRGDTSKTIHAPGI
jgi:hypothetical protein